MKSILLHVHADDGLDTRFEAALDIARTHNAHLTCLQVMPYVLYGGGMMTGVVIAADVYADAMRDTRKKFEADLKNEDVSWSWIDSRGGGAPSILAHSQLSDLIVLSRAGPALDIEGPAPIVGDIAVRARCPVFLASDGKKGFDSTAPVLVAWNGAPEAAAALRNTRTMLAKSKAVHILSVEEGGAMHIPARAAAEYLSRYDIHAETHGRPVGDGIASTIRSVADEVGARSVIMGAYGRSRLFEYVLGGVTRRMIEDSELPLILMH